MTVTGIFCVYLFSFLLNIFDMPLKFSVLPIGSGWLNNVIMGNIRRDVATKTIKNRKTIILYDSVSIIAKQWTNKTVQAALSAFRDQWP